MYKLLALSKNEFPQQHSFTGANSVCVSSQIDLILMQLNTVKNANSIVYIY